MLILCGSNHLVNMNGCVMYLNLTHVIQDVVNTHMLSRRLLSHRINIKLWICYVRCVVITWFTLNVNPMWLQPPG